MAVAFALDWWQNGGVLTVARSVAVWLVALVVAAVVVVRLGIGAAPSIGAHEACACCCGGNEGGGAAAESCCEHSDDESKEATLVCRCGPGCDCACSGESGEGGASAWLLIGGWGPVRVARLSCAEVVSVPVVGWVEVGGVRWRSVPPEGVGVRLARLGVRTT